MTSEYSIFLVLYLAGMLFRTGYEILKKAGRVNAKSRIVFTLVFAAMFLMWMSWFGMCPLDPVKLAMPAVVSWIGLVMLFMGLGLAVVALVQLRGLENIDRLVTTGIFSKIRHPMYTGFILLILGLAVYHSAVTSLGAGLVGIGNILYWRRLEEEELEFRYGKEYLNYRKGTWF